MSELKVLLITGHERYYSNVTRVGIEDGIYKIQRGGKITNIPVRNVLTLDYDGDTLEQEQEQEQDDNWPSWMER